MEHATGCLPEVLERLVDEYGTTMLRTCCVYLADEDKARDAVQDAFLKIYRAWPGFDNPNTEKAWIMRVTVNVCKDTLRNAWNRKVTLIEEYPDIAAPQTGESDCGELYEQIMALAPKYRQVILLYYYQELKIKEIAHVLGVTQSTVGVRLKRARKQLEQRLVCSAT